MRVSWRKMNGSQYTTLNFSKQSKGLRCSFLKIENVCPDLTKTSPGMEGVVREIFITMAVVRVFRKLAFHNFRWNLQRLVSAFDFTFVSAVTMENKYVNAIRSKIFPVHSRAVVWSLVRNSLYFSMNGLNSH